ncbi:MAG: hypothetical protein K6B41_03420 [Butyrivibrio sp.]|nr:hypothetical protein [Butyrivibrio sp.]
MKNKLYFLLYVFYVLVVAFILYINGVFTGEIGSMVNLIINLCFLVVIGIMFIISGISFAAINKCTNDLLNAREIIINKYKANGNKPYIVNGDNQDEIFTEENLKDALYKYCLRLEKFHVRNTYKKGTDIEEYINEDLIDEVGMNFYNSGVSGALTGLGILGTFLGLSIGLGSFSGNDIFTISDNVGPLLSGMKVAFHTSVYGIFFSLIFNVIYRGMMADAYSKLEGFLEVFKQCAQPENADANADMASLLIYQNNIVSSLKEIVELQKGISNAQMTELTRISEKFVSEMTHACGVEFKALGDTLKNVTSTETKMLESNKSLVMAADELIESSRTLQQAVKNTMETQNVFAEELKGQKEAIDKACEDIGNQLYTYNNAKQIEII